MIRKSYFKKSYGREIIFVALISLIIFIFFSFFSYSQQDISWVYYTTKHDLSVRNWFGVSGAYVAAICIYLFGAASFLLIFSCLICLYMLMLQKKNSYTYEIDRLCASLCFVLTTAGLCRIYKIDFWQSDFPGGIAGDMFVQLLYYFFEPFGGFIFLHLLSYICLIVLFKFSCMNGIMKLGAFARFCVLFIRRQLVRPNGIGAYFMRLICFVGVQLGFFLGVIKEMIISLVEGSLFDQTVFMVFGYDEQAGSDLLDNNCGNSIDSATDTIVGNAIGSAIGSAFDVNLKNNISNNSNSIGNSIGNRTGKENFNKQAQQADTQNIKTSKIYVLPDRSFFVQKKIDLVDMFKIDDLDKRARLLEEKLERFGIQGKVVGIKRGPLVTLFEYEPHINAKLSKIIAMADDLAMALTAHSVRILAPIPGRSLVGFEVANRERTNVLFADTLHASEYKKSSYFLPLILGQNTVGKAVVVDLAHMPHLLIAGSTGSGKSVALNAMLISLLCARKPDELKLILIDPKRLEFTAYEHIAHLLLPIITDTREAIPVLKWLALNMDKRYAQMATVGARNIFDYNVQADEKKEYERMPFIVLVIDELADLMIMVGKEVEESIARITQMARAAGIHLVVATQRPSVDVITGSIKVNFPSRISFRVTSRIDSRTILDTGGADTLLGKGDMLFLDSTTATLQRVHGAYVSDAEIAYVTNSIRSQAGVEYIHIAQEMAATHTNSFGEKDDILFQSVLHFLDEIDNVSISLLQRKFNIGYNRSARIIEQLEKMGRVMPSDGAKTRHVIK